MIRPANITVDEAMCLLERAWRNLHGAECRLPDPLALHAWTGRLSRTRDRHRARRVLVALLYEFSIRSSEEVAHLVGLRHGSSVMDSIHAAARSDHALLTDACALAHAGGWKRRNI